MERVFDNQKQLEQFGVSLGENAKEGTVIALLGDLGVGKTTLTKSIAKGLGVKEHITSPTFSIVKEYDSGRLPLYHMDLYRISDESELFYLGFEDYVYSKGVSVIEWADRAEELPDDTMYIELSYGDGEEKRNCKITY